MVPVAVAGGSSPGFGTAIVAALRARHFPVVILSRAKPESAGASTSSSPPYSSSSPSGNDEGVVTKSVDYDDPAALTTALAGIHTLISVILIPDPHAWLANQLALLSAAQRAGVRRFAPSEFALGPRAHALIQPVFAPKLKWWDACRASGLEVARFHIGYLMNYLGHGCPGDEVAALGGRPKDDKALFYDLAAGEAEVPVVVDTEEGFPRITLTEMGDVGRFVAAACALPDGAWREEMGIAGDTLRFDEVLAIVEDVTGREMRVRRKTAAEYEEEARKGLERGDVLAAMAAQFGKVYCLDQSGAGVVEGVVNGLCPEVRPLSTRRFVERFWGRDAGSS